MLTATILERRVDDGQITVVAEISLDGTVIGKATGQGATLAQVKADLKVAAQVMQQVVVGMTIDLSP